MNFDAALNSSDNRIADSFSVTTVDTHTGGEPTRTLVAGPHSLHRTETVEDARRLFSDRFDEVRLGLLNEPRGHDGMFGAVPIPTVTDTTDFGVFFMNIDGYKVDMCIHGTIGSVTGLANRGIIPIKSNYRIDTPAGCITVEAGLMRDNITGISLHNVPSFVLESVSTELVYDGVQTSVSAAIVYVGNFYALIDVEDLEATLESQTYPSLIKTGVDALDKLNRNHIFQHPITGEKKPVTGVQFYGLREGTHANLMVGPKGKIDRSPCGTGTCARMALQYVEGSLEVGEEFVHEGPLKTRYVGEITDVESLTEDLKAIRPKLTGSAAVTGVHEFQFSKRDKLIGFNNLKSAHSKFELFQR